MVSLDEAVTARLKRGSKHFTADLTHRRKYKMNLFIKKTVFSSIRRQKIGYVFSNYNLCRCKGLLIFITLPDFPAKKS